nr:nuclear transport factor 2 family protein [Micromonospora kangleipakensis]
MTAEEGRQVIEVLARYVRGSDRRDGNAVAALYTKDAVTELYSRTGPQTYEPILPPLEGPGPIEALVSQAGVPMPAGVFTHHVTADHTVTVDVDTAHLSAQFVLYETRAGRRPEHGWRPGTSGTQGTVRPIESGYYETDLRRVDGRWRITRHRVYNDMPVVIPPG